MNFKQLDVRAENLWAEGVRSKFYEMVLLYGLQNLNADQLEKLTEEHITQLLAIMIDYLDNCYHVSAYDVADAITICINRVGLEEFLANGEQLMIDELCCM